jgi:hypothetical protein
MESNRSGGATTHTAITQAETKRFHERTTFISDSRKRNAKENEVTLRKKRKPDSRETITYHRSYTQMIPVRNAFEGWVPVDKSKAPKNSAAKKQKKTPTEWGGRTLEPTANVEEKARMVETVQREMKARGYDSLREFGQLLGGFSAKELTLWQKERGTSGKTKTVRQAQLETELKAWMKREGISYDKRASSVFSSTNGQMDRQVFNPETGEGRLEEGDVVDVKWRGGTHFYKGTIAKRNVNSKTVETTYDVVYADSDKEKNVAVKYIRYPSLDRDAEPQQVVDSRYKDGERQFFVKWTGKPPEKNTWEPMPDHDKAMADLIVEYDRRARKRNREILMSEK